MIVVTPSYQYFKTTGTALNYNVIALWLPDVKEVAPVLTGSVPLSIWVLLLVALCYVTLGPWLLARTISRGREWSSPRANGRREPSQAKLEATFS